MPEALLEGIRAAVQPCSLALVVPGAGMTVLAGRWGPAVAGSFAVGALVAAWAQASLLLDIGSGWLVGLLLAAVASTGLWLTLRMAAAGPAVGGVLVGAAAGTLWQPCVGPALGTILSGAPADPPGALLPLAAYLGGLLWVTVVLSAAPWVHPHISRAVAHPAVRTAAALPVALLVIVLATGRYPQIIGALVRASSLG